VLDAKDAVKSVEGDGEGPGQGQRPQPRGGQGTQGPVRCRQDQARIRGVSRRAPRRGRPRGGALGAHLDRRHRRRPDPHLQEPPRIQGDGQEGGQDPRQDRRQGPSRSPTRWTRTPTARPR
jgi:hypothetical protein